jgi:hypothetical protein
MDDCMDNTTPKLIEYVLTKLETEPVAKRIQLYDVLADLLPNEEASLRLKKYSKELQRIDLELQRIKALFFLTSKNENHEQ